MFISQHIIRTSNYQEVINVIPIIDGNREGVLKNFIKFYQTIYERDTACYTYVIYLTKYYIKCPDFLQPPVIRGYILNL